MADKSFPGPVGSPTEAMDWADWLDWAGPVTGAGVIGDSGSSLQVFADSTGLQVKVRAGRAFVRGPQRRVENQLTLAVDGPSGSPRIDRVIARRKSVTDGGGIEIVVKKGAPAATPQPPSLTQEDHGVWEIPLARFPVSGSAATITAADIIDERTFLATADETASASASVWTTTPHTTHPTPYTPLAVAWNQEQFDTANIHSSTSNPTRLTAPIAGLYEVYTKLKTASTAYASGVQLGVNGTPDTRARVIVPAEVSAGAYSQIRKTYQLAAGDYVEVFSLGQAASLTLTVAECFAEMRRVG